MIKYKSWKVEASGYTVYVPEGHNEYAIWYRKDDGARINLHGVYFNHYPTLRQTKAAVEYLLK